jgi:hypothetical protein
MKLLVTTGNKAEYVEGRNITIPANQTDYELENAGMRDIVALKDEPNGTSLKIEYEFGDIKDIRAVITTTDATGGATEGFAQIQLVDERYNVAITGQYRIELAVYQDADAVTPATTAVLNDASVGAKGTILSTKPATAIKAKTDPDATLYIGVNNAADETTYVACDAGTPGGPDIEASDVAAIIHSA